MLKVVIERWEELGPADTPPDVLGARGTPSVHWVLQHCAPVWPSAPWTAGPIQGGLRRATNPPAQCGGDEGEDDGDLASSEGTHGPGATRPGARIQPGGPNHESSTRVRRSWC